MTSGRQKTVREKLFGAACLKVTLERSGAKAAQLEIYQGSLSDLGLTEAEVDAFLAEHRPEVVAALAAHRKKSKEG